MDLPPEFCEDRTGGMYTLEDLYLSGANGVQVENIESNSSSPVDYDLIAKMSEMEVQVDPLLFSPCVNQEVHGLLDQSQLLDVVTDHPTQTLNANYFVHRSAGNTPSRRVKRTRTQAGLEQDVVSPVCPNKLVPCKKVEHECIMPPNGMSYVDFALHLWKTCPEKGWKCYPCLMECLIHDYKHLLEEIPSVHIDKFNDVMPELLEDSGTRAKARLRF
ncbi:hypothetical protein ACP70R_036643 [Stipagrostis hirtigluma subsp. patula]